MPISEKEALVREEIARALDDANHGAYFAAYQRMTEASRLCLEILLISKEVK